MTASLKQVFEKLNTVSEKEQNAIALLLTEEMRWDETFSKSQDVLANMANEALAEYKKGKTKPMDLK